MEDAFQLALAYQGAYRARLNANLAFWDRLDGNQDWPTNQTDAHPLTELLLGDFLVVDLTKPYAERGSFLEIELATRASRAHQTCGGRGRAGTPRPSGAAPGVEVIWRQDCYQLPTGRTSFGFKDGIGQPAVEGSGIPGSNPRERPIKAGEFILGYPDETGSLPPMPTPELLGRNGTYIVFRKLHTRVAAYRRHLHERAASREEEEEEEALLGAKMVGRWQSGAPLTLSPDHDDPQLGQRADQPAPPDRPLRAHGVRPATRVSTSERATRPSGSRVGLKIVMSRPVAWSLATAVRSTAVSSSQVSPSGRR
jgi:hypothetical protein